MTDIDIDDGVTCLSEQAHQTSARVPLQGAASWGNLMTRYDRYCPFRLKVSYCNHFPAMLHRYKQNHVYRRPKTIAHWLMTTTNNQEGCGHLGQIRNASLSLQRNLKATCSFLNKEEYFGFRF